MNSIQELFQQAQLAEAAYADFSVPGVGLKDALISEGMSEPQATEFTNNWREVDQYTATGWIGQTWTGTGFSATLFQNKNTNAYTLAIRGSTGVNDFLADAQLIATDGVAFDQLIELYNYWQSLNAPAGANYQAAYLKTSVAETAQLSLLWAATQVPMADAAAIPAYMAYKAYLENAGFRVQNGTVKEVARGNSTDVLTGTQLVTGSGKISICPNLDVVGHSLGGHLSMAFPRLFPSVNANVLAVNGLGFKSGNATVSNLFSKLGGAASFNSSQIQNVYGIAGPEFATMNNSILQQPGGYDGVYIESGSLLPPIMGGHSMSQMTDTHTIVGDKDYGNDPEHPLADEYGNPLGNPMPGNGEMLRGYNDNDRIQGLGGKDILQGKEGNDILEGGTDSDIIVGSIGDISEGGNTNVHHANGNILRICRIFYAQASNEPEWRMAV